MKLRSGGHFNNSAAHDQSHYYGSDQAKPVARAAFLATRLTPAPVFRTALFADFIAFAVLDFLRFAIFVPLDSRFVQLGSFLHLCKPVLANRNDEGLDGTGVSAQRWRCQGQGERHQERQSLRAASH